MPHRSESSHSSHSSPRLRHPEYYDDYYSRPSSRHSQHRHHHHRHRRHHSRSGSDDDLSEHSSRSKHGHPPRLKTPTPQSPMYAPAKLTYPSVDNTTQRRQSTYGTLTRRHEDDSSDYSDEPPRHAHVARSKRHSTFPPSAYYSSPHHKQIQPYQQPYVHPALPPQSPVLAPAGAGRPMSMMQYTPRPGLGYEPPERTYQPPTAEPPRPPQPTRAESWGHSAFAESTADPASRLSRTGSRSVPPNSRSRSVRGDPHDKTKDAAHGPWQKAKEVYHSKTANNTAELALFGLLAVAKAL